MDRIHRVRFRLGLLYVGGGMVMQEGTFQARPPYPSRHVPVSDRARTRTCTATRVRRVDMMRGMGTGSGTGRVRVGVGVGVGVGVRVRVRVGNTARE